MDDLADALTLHVLEDKMGRAGKVLLELGKAEMGLSLPSPEPSLQPSLLLSLVMRPNAVTHLEGLDADKISRSVGEIRYLDQATQWTLVLILCFPLKEVFGNSGGEQRGRWGRGGGTSSGGETFKVSIDIWNASQSHVFQPAFW